MSQVPVKNLKNEELRNLELPEGVFGYAAKPHLVYEAVCHYRAVGRAGSHATKNRTVVAGGGRKPWRQKKTGRSRHGSIRSPLWRGGGTIHGPEPRDHGYRMPRRMRWNALRSVLSEKAREGKLVVVEDLELESHRTRDLQGVLTTLGLGDVKTLLVDADANRSLDLASRNLSRVQAARAMGLNAYDVLDHEVIVLSVSALEALREWLGR
jgi:large subunit ribosomal protein L4